MDDNGYPSRWWSRLLFEPRQLQDREWWLGLTLVVILLGGAWLIFWPYIPQLLANIFTSLFDLATWIGGLFSGGGGGAPVDTSVASPQIPLPSPSPSISPSPSPFPR